MIVRPSSVHLIMLKARPSGGYSLCQHVRPFTDLKAHLLGSFLLHIWGGDWSLGFSVLLNSADVPHFSS